MLTCPMCKKTLSGLDRQCSSCKTDVSLLVSYVEDLDVGLVRAEAHTRAGELGDAVWSYLEVLEVDPDNETARQQVGRVAMAVRQFDRLAQGRRWLDRLHNQARFRQWLQTWGSEGSPPRFLAWALVAFAILIAFFLGLLLGQQAARHISTGSAAESSSE